MELRRCEEGYLLGGGVEEERGGILECIGDSDRQGEYPRFS